MLTFGLYWKPASKVGAYLALICGFVALVGLKPVQNLLGMEDISSAIVGLAVIALSAVVMVVGSLVFPDRHPVSDFKEQ